MREFFGLQLKHHPYKIVYGLYSPKTIMIIHQITMIKLSAMLLVIAKNLKRHYP